MILTSTNLFSKISRYLKIRGELLAHLSKHPNDWLRFQEMFNFRLDKIYQDIMDFELKNMKQSESKVYKLKKIFEKRYRHYFLYGEFIKWSYDKPFGYAGDFKIIDAIYLNHPRKSGFDRLWDNYFQQLATTDSIRERKEDFKKFILDFVKERNNKHTRIMNLACGPAREIKELLQNDTSGLFSKVTFDCYDYDQRAIEYAKKLLNNTANVNFFQKNAIRLALKKDIKQDLKEDYDLIYSTGLFDYLDERVAIRLVCNLKNLLKRDGIMIISNAAEKHNNSSAGWMEWVADWYLIYRSPAEFKKIFVNAGFQSENIKIIPQHSKVMQYCLAKI